VTKAPRLTAGAFVYLERSMDQAVRARLTQALEGSPDKRCVSPRRADLAYALSEYDRVSAAYVSNGLELASLKAASDAQAVMIAEFTQPPFSAALDRISHPAAIVALMIVCGLIGHFAP
jgi:hypothetical protein